MPAEDPLWYKDAIIYEVHVRAFQDSDGDGIGDFEGLTSRLDYLRDLGVTAIWLLPFFPSPLKDDGYDIADYYSINRIYGTLRDFKTLLSEAHARNLRVITELVINHTSDQHPWFQRSRRAKPGSPWRDFYVWSESPEKYKDARIIFRDFEHSNWSWDPVANAYFWHRFYSHQPDLNFESPLVRREISRVLDFWFDMGVDGVRLDAIPYLYEREGTSCENLRETHEYLKTLRTHVDEKYGDRLLLAEANQWPEDAVSYFGSGKGDECHMAFHFPLMPRIFMAVRMEDRVPIVDILEQTPPIPETSQWAMFLRNHDELTLEMVTDEERDYMYRVYASVAKARINLGIRRRLAPLLGNDRKRIELLHLLLLSFPGTPVLYYGDEIGMGDNIFLGDRNGVRTPMQWSSDKNAGFSKASPQALFLPIILDPEYHYEAINVEAQQGNANSLWWWVKRVLSMRKRYAAFGRGTIEFLHPENRKILAFIRRHKDEAILVVANLSRFPQAVQLDLSAFKHLVPIELFGRTPFPEIKETPYFFTLTPHAAFWFSLEPGSAGQHSALSHREERPLLNGIRWEETLQEDERPQLEKALRDYVRGQHWFCGRDREIKSLYIKDATPVPGAAAAAFLLIVNVDYTEGEPDEYLLPISFAIEAERVELEAHAPHLVIARLRLQPDDREGVIYDAIGNRGVCKHMLHAISRRRAFKGQHGTLRGIAAEGWRLPGDANLPSHLEPAFPVPAHRNTVLAIGDQYFFKLFRRVEVGTNPNLEIERFLAAKKFPHVPGLAGSLRYDRHEGEFFTVGILTRFVRGAKDGWEFTMDAIGRFFERTATRPLDGHAFLPREKGLLSAAEKTIPDPVHESLGTYYEAARLLGQRTADLHLALASSPDNPDFAPEPFTPFYQRSLFQSMRNQAVQTFQLLRRLAPNVPEDTRALAQRAGSREADVLKCLRNVYDRKISAQRIRCHGDLHLGEVLYTGKDFLFFDFEGEAARPLGERRIKRTAIRDVASMLRSFDYVAQAGFQRQLELATIEESQRELGEQWSWFWRDWVSAVYLRAYLQAVEGSGLMPANRDELETLLNTHLLEKAVFEINYELRNHLERLIIPLRSLHRLLDTWKS
jgi:maltose alpha-D-glucosyltransferase/alpha-amylase